MSLPKDAVVIGAGPFGLSTAAHLRDAGVTTHVFGAAMSYWRRSMPVGMFLRSSQTASSISAPGKSLTFGAFRRQRGVPTPKPTPLDDFIEYGDWFAERVVPDLDARQVVMIEREGSGFQIHVEDGEVMEARSVIVATGLQGCANRPAVFGGLPPEVVSHTTELREPAELAGRRVLVVGGGQSAIESGVLLHEAGADVEILIRAEAVRWLSRSAKLHRYSGPLQPLVYAPHDVGPPGLSWLVAKPGLWHRLPLERRERLAYRAIRPAASAWLIDRAQDVTITTGRRVTVARMDGAEVALEIDDGGTRRVEHVVLGTGFKFDVAAHPLLSADIVSRLERIDGYPRLGPGLESSVPGLHFLGAMSALSFGPVMRFVSGTWYSAPAAAAQIATRARGRKGAAGGSEQSVGLAPAGN